MITYNTHEETVAFMDGYVLGHKKGCLLGYEKCLKMLDDSPELRKAHQANNKAVMQAYGMPIKETDEAACVAWLMRLYQEKVR